METLEGSQNSNHSNIPSLSIWIPGETPLRVTKNGRINANNKLAISLSNEKRTAKKICRVCGDKAFSYNFNVITCESCKAFFRRNANKEKEIRCPFNNSCDITTLSRRFCQRCRLQKCFDVGMKKEWIMSEKARMEKRQRFIENKEQRTTEFGTVTSDKPDTTTELEESPTSSIERPTPVIPDESSRMSNAFMSFTSASCENQHLPKAGVMAPLSSSFDLPNLRTTEAFSPLFQETGFSPSVDSITTNSLMGPPLQTTSPFIFGPPQDCDIATQQGTTQLEQYFQQQAFAQTVLQPLSAALCQPGSGDCGNEVVTLPKLILMKLIQKTTMQNQIQLPPGHETMGVRPKCQCTCTCGRYRPGSLIVDEVMKDILANPNSRHGSISSSSRINCEVKTNHEVNKKSDPFISPFNLSNTAYSLKSNQSAAQSKRSPTSLSQSDVARISHKVVKSTLLEKEMNSIQVDPDCCLMTSIDQDRLSEVVSADAVWSELEPNIPEREWGDQGHSTLYDLINLADTAIRRMIKMTKRLSTFQKIEHHDQILLLKGSCLEYIILRSALYYIPTKKSWRTPDCNSQYLISINSLKNAPDNLLGQFIRFYSLFKNEFRTNKYAILLIGMLVIFNPDCSNLRNRVAVEEEQTQYKRVLKRLLFSLCGQDQIKTNEKLAILLANIYDLKKLSQRTQKVIRELDPEKVEPLLLEMFCR